MNTLEEGLCSKFVYAGRTTLQVERGKKTSSEGTGEKAAQILTDWWESRKNEAEAKLAIVKDAKIDDQQQN